MKKGLFNKIMSVILTVIMTGSVLTGCSYQSEKEDKETISVYLWSTVLYDELAPYIQSKLPDVNIQFVVGNNDLDFYRFMKENGKLPDIITMRRFSLHDVAEIKDQLMDLSSTEQAGTIYETYLDNFTNADNSINWLPMCGEVDGFVANKALFDEYKIPFPTDYDSFVYACQEFEKVGIRGFVADFEYDYTCMEILQGLSIPEITSMDGRVWRSSYEDPNNTERVGLDDKVWPEAFAVMEKFISDVNIQPDDATLSYDPVIEMFTEGKAAIIRSGGSNLVAFRDMGMDAVFMPYFGQNGEEWLLTYPAFQVALNKDLENDPTRKKNALRVLDVMLSEEGQNKLAKGEDVITYSQNVNLKMSSYFDNISPIMKRNYMYIRIASGDFFSVSKEVVTKMIQKEYDAKQAYEMFDSMLKQSKEDTTENILTVERDYSNIFHSKGGNETYSVMANSLRGFYGSDVLIAPCNSFTGSLFKAEYDEKMVGYMIMPNPLCAWKAEMTGEELKKLLKDYVEGKTCGIKPFNRGSLPTVSGISIEVNETDGQYILERVLKDDKELKDDAVLQVTCLDIPGSFNGYLEEENYAFTQEEDRVRVAWIAYIKEGATLAEPEEYIMLK
ncbi:MAG: carbohydrate ABC transporter substrate-binding protein [Lachnospiraceae bacterium]|nr:carbohydrate ABC transporter substrate-binding protein [Lachnospiraceae bacterium]